MKLVYTDADGASITIERDADDLTATDFIEQVVRPMMLIVGYHPDSIDDALGT